MRSHFARCALALLWLSLACCEDGFGRAIVGVAPRDGVARVPCVQMAQDCGGPPMFPALQPPPAPSLNLSVCGNAGRACDLLNGPTANLSGCNLDATLVSREPQQNPFQTLDCARASFTIDATLASIRLDNMKLTHSELTLIASTPTVVELSAAQLTSTNIELRGPITLRLIDQSKLATVQIVDSTGAASIDLVEGSLNSVSVVGLRGLFSAERSTLSSSSVFASTVQLETCVLTDTQLVADQLFGVELKNKRVSVEFDTATLSAADSDTLNVQRCGSLLITNSVITGGNFAACSAGMRMDRSSLISSRVWGPLETHVVIVNGNAFGSGVATSWESWNDSLSNNRFCETMGRLTLFATATLRCNDCELVPPPVEQLFCSLPMSQTMLPSDFVVVAPTQLIGDAGFGYSANPSCTVLDMLPECSPRPVNENPF